MARLAFMGVAIVVLIEIALFIIIGRAIGLGPTLLGVVLGTVFGSLIVRERGLRLLAELREAVERGRLPGLALADAMLVSFAGVLIAVPGFFTDVLGLLLLLPPLRVALYRFIGRRLGMPPSGRGGGASGGPPTIDLDRGAFRPHE